MVRVLLIIQILASVAVCFAQTGTPQPSREAEVRTAIEKISGLTDIKLSGVLFDMRVFNGKFVGKDDRTFTIFAKGDKQPRGSMTIRYEQVLELEGPGISLSYFPDPDTAPYSNWDELKRIAYGDTLEIDRLEGASVTGVYLRATDSEIVVLKGNKTHSVNRDEVRRVFLARREPHSAKKAGKGAAKTARKVGRAPSGSRTIGSAAGAAMINTAILAGAAAAGAIGSGVQRSPNDRLLLYAK